MKVADAGNIQLFAVKHAFAFVMAALAALF
jgi:hypothetical protein